MAHMSRDARRIINTIQGLSGIDCSFQDQIEAEQLTYSYYAKTIEGHINRFFNPKSDKNPHTVSFYVKPTRSVNKGRRDKENWIMTDPEIEIYSTICSMLIEDFSRDVLIIICGICNSYDIQEVRSGIKISQDEGVYSVHYLLRILERQHAEHEKKIELIKQHRSKFNGVQQSDTVARPRIELASMRYEWKESIKDQEIEEELNKTIIKREDVRDDR